MKPISETYKELGIAFSFPIEIKDANGNETYREDISGWSKCEYDAKGNKTYYENSDRYWARYERDAKGNKTYYEDSKDYWSRYERDANGNETYFENSNGYKWGTPRSTTNQ